MDKELTDFIEQILIMHSSLDFGEKDYTDILSEEERLAIEKMLEEYKKEVQNKQKLIEKLKNDSGYFIKEAGSYVRDEASIEQERLIAKFEYANEILKIAKGENDEQNNENIL